jgi:hypothetical protein
VSKKKKGKKGKGVKTADKWQEELEQSIPAGHGSSIRVNLLPPVPRLGPTVPRLGPPPDEPGAVFFDGDIRTHVG